MILRRATAVLLVLILFLGPTLAYRKMKKGGMSAARKDNDGFGFFSKSSKRDKDPAYFPRRFDDDDNHKSSKPSSRRNNFYASKKMEEYGQKMGNSMATMIKSLFGYEQPSKTISGKKVKSANNPQTFNHDLGTDWQSICMVVVCALLCIVLIYYLLTKKLFDRDDTEILTKKARMRHHENYKNFQILRYIKENGVHPDRATGKIYDINL